MLRCIQRFSRYSRLLCRTFSDQKLQEVQTAMPTATSAPNFNYGFPTPGPQNPTPQKVMDHVFFVSNTEWKTVRESMKFDFVVIGTGFGGFAFVERTLRNNPHSNILMLERGPFFLPTHFQNLPVPYQQTLGGLSETFPFTLSAKTILDGSSIKWMHGSIPFFGGRSIMWSAWCPRPTVDEMAGWPSETIAAAAKYFTEAEKLLNVIPANMIDGAKPKPCSRPIYGVLQRELMKMLKAGLDKIPSATRVIDAPLAVSDPSGGEETFLKYSTPGPILEMLDRQRTLAGDRKGARVTIATECVVQKVIQQDGLPTALETSRGIVPLGDAKLVLGMGTFPATTLVLNSFPQVKSAGRRFTAHFITSVICRVPRADYDFAGELQKEQLSIAAIYLAGLSPQKGQYHIQLTALSDLNPEKNASNAARHMPDVIATASPRQLRESKDYVVFVCAVLGEMNHKNPENWFRRNDDVDPTINATLQATACKEDSETWDTMDEGTFQAVEKVLSPYGASKVEYWHPRGSGDDGVWRKEVRPNRAQRRVPGLVHEGSTMHIGDNEEAVVDLNYQLKGVKNVYVTGTSLWPASGSWNPTMTMVALAQDLAEKLTPRRDDKEQ